MNVTDSKWEVGFWWKAGKQKHPVQYAWFKALDGICKDGKFKFVIPWRLIVRQVVPIRLDKCPIDNRIIAVTLSWIGFFFRFRPFHPRCVGYSITDIDEFHVSRWYHHPKNIEAIYDKG